MSRINERALLAGWRDGKTITKLASELGVTRQAVSFALNRHGIRPNDRRMSKANLASQARVGASLQRNARRLERESQRDDAIAALRAIALEHGCSANTLGQYAAKHGPYKHPTKHKPDPRTTLPHRWTPEGDALSERIKSSTKPWSSRYIGVIA